MKTFCSYDDYLQEYLASYWNDTFYDCPEISEKNPFNTNTTVLQFSFRMAKHIHKSLCRDPDIGPSNAHVLMLSDQFQNVFAHVMTGLASHTGGGARLPSSIVQQATVQRTEEIIDLLKRLYKSKPDVIEDTQRDLNEKGVGQVPPPTLQNTGKTGCCLTILLFIFATTLFFSVIL
jgi:hypothetical protein